MALDLSALTAEVARNRSVDGSAAALIRGIVARIAAAIAADNLSNTTNLNALMADLKTSTDDLSAAVSENTPTPEPEPEPEPTPEPPV